MNPFEQRIDRRNSGSVKWDDLQAVFGSEDVLPLWVADMDFQAPSAVIDALRRRVEQGVFGYTMQPPEYFQAAIGWMKRRHHWEIEQDWITFCPGVVPALSLLVQACTDPGDRVIIQPPVYPPFYRVVEDNGRELLLNPLCEADGDYRMDLDSLREQMDERVKMLILCSPHNPIGRVWSRSELEELAVFAAEHSLIVVADEIHADLVFQQGAHTPYASVSETARDHSIICTAPSKTFNLAGLSASNIIIPNAELRSKFKKEIARMQLGTISLFGMEGAKAAYEHGDEWLDQCLAYIRKNMEYVRDYLTEHLPRVRTKLPDATYLMWLDFRSCGMDHASLNQFLIQEAGLGLNSGAAFGAAGEGFMRINLACHRSLVEEAMNRLSQAFGKLKPAYS
ncbi:cystathionine beta-lyase [Paenibacillus sp. CAA11]|uniref:MalY/PatB family protein n=1 Tax=Paenibacillus sp. CAA11 TaxID=1532905 RepID=UPI000D34FDBD|nr:PatB family C-S lyase [Paenibacillus sp. CAA11]AWB43578.1 cystathionine beta-lyase [Paenibacillus sp. CAA11]